MTKGEVRKQRQVEHAARQKERVQQSGRTTADVMLDWTRSRIRRRAKVAREYWDRYESGAPMGSGDY